MADIANGARVTTQIPLDEKCYFLTLALMTNLGTSNNLAFTYYEGMIVFCLETKIYYIWQEVITGVTSINNLTFIYPVNSNIGGIDYSNRSFNFVKYFDPSPYNGRLKFSKRSDNLNRFDIEGGDYVEGDIDGTKHLIGGYYVTGNVFTAGSYDQNTIVLETKPTI